MIPRIRLTVQATGEPVYVNAFAIRALFPTAHPAESDPETRGDVYFEYAPMTAVILDNFESAPLIVSERYDDVSHALDRALREGIVSTIETASIALGKVAIDGLARGLEAGGYRRTVRALRRLVG